jgi:hypothetical protein
MDDNKNTTELIKERYQGLPLQVKDAVTASDLPVKMKTIADDNSLMLDQAGALQNEILFVMLGMEPSSEFVKNISKELNINKEKANAIAKDVNQLIFDPIRKYLREWEEQEEKTIKENENQQSITDLERAGGFTIEHSGQNGNGGAPINLPGAEEVTESKEDLVASIENPIPTKPAIPVQEYNHTEALVDRLLAGPMTAVEQKTVQTSPQEQATAKPEPKAPQTPPKPAGPDSYREPIQ